MMVHKCIHVIHVCAFSTFVGHLLASTWPHQHLQAQWHLRNHYYWNDILDHLAA